MGLSECHCYKNRENWHKRKEKKSKEKFLRNVKKEEK
jgi:hypothetical protein